MDSFLPENEKPNEEIYAPIADPRKGWKEWLGTDEAVRWVYLIFGFFAILLLMVLLQFSTKAICCGDWDGYYHIRWSALLWENFSQFKWLPEFKWLPLTVLNSGDYADHHFLFHLLQIPFLWFFEPVLAAKVSTVFYGTLAVFSIYWLLFRYGMDYMLLWLLALLTCANPFFYRMNMGKAPPLTIIYTVAGIYLLFERKYVWLLPLAFVFVWTYSLFPLLFFAAVIWVLIIAWNERKFEWQPLAYTGGGLILGNLINPYFPQNIGLFWEHFITKFKVGSDFAVSVGGEWYPYTGQELLTHFPVAIIAMLIGYVLFMPKNGKLPEKSTFMLAFVTLLFASQFRSKRFAEYFPPFAILFAAFSLKEFLVPAVIALPDEFKRELEPFLDKDKDSKQEASLRLIKQVAAVFIGLGLSVFLILNLAGFKPLEHTGLITDIQNNEANDRYQRAMNWASENIPENEIIFNCNWDDFPKMFFFDTKHRYTYGLDPHYLFSKNPELYRLIGDITSGKIEDPGPIIREKFGANFIFTDAKENQDFIAKCLSSGWCETAYEDDEALILMIRQQQGEAPNDDPDENELTEEEKKQLEEEEKADNSTLLPDEDEEK